MPARRVRGLRRGVRKGSRVPRALRGGPHDGTGSRSEGDERVTRRPNPDEYAPFYAGYIGRVPEAEILPVLAAQLETLRRLPALVSPARESFAYAPGKWSIRQLVGHLGDGERVFGFRAFAFSHGDATPLPGFDENAYVSAARSHVTPLTDLVDELVFLREANLRMLRALDDATWTARGLANGHAISVRALAFIMAGHVRHHLDTLRTRYDVKLPL